MSVRKRGLGRGLDALLGTGKSLHSAGAEAPDTAGAEEAPLRQLPVELIQRGKYQPRRDMDDFNKALDHSPPELITSQTLLI